MTFLHIQDQGLPQRALGERRRDRATAQSVDDALRARGMGAQAQAMAFQAVSLEVALRVLGDGGQRRAPVHAALPTPDHVLDFVPVAA